MPEPTNSDLLRPLDVARLHSEFVSSPCFPFVTIDEFLQPEFARAVAAAYPTPEQASSKGRSFDAVNERGKTQVTDPAHFPAPVRALNELLASPEWLATISKITGIPRVVADESLIGGGMHIPRL